MRTMLQQDHCAVQHLIQICMINPMLERHNDFFISKHQR
jgi:hypothetical protein